ncbi:TadE/TadG family type IV pilus assembly protein [Sphingomonas mollis]|uniref:Pilus assembly protein n=1 Tax=Sphingomonas mollis TaxID=2795726 RepID=A0ABS0XTV4_9SPHN|nr:TadE family protein [Sphingomonas sp. BT553]MBJ6123478.1 pilus assembly protein [Sphingomonas sp. BT553]
MTRDVRDIAHETRGATILEFGIVAPVMCLLLVGGFDIAHTQYMRAVLQGIVQKTARDSGLEGASTAAIDNQVRTQVLAINMQAKIDFTRRYYRTFTDAVSKTPEPWNDTNGNGVCDKSEQYQDNNNNMVWDNDGGDQGQGGAKDRVVYTATVKYPRILPLDKFVGASDTVQISASTVLMNQPYGDQSTYGAPTPRNCPA